MKPETILQSDLLDIIFEDRNKAYGAYMLRKEYNSRLGKALAVTFSLVFIFALTEYLKANYFNDKSPTANKIFVKDLEISRLEDKKPKEKVEEKKEPKAKPQAKIQDTPPVIVDDKLVDKPLPTIDELKDKIIGTETVEGDPAPPTEIAVPEGKNTGDGVVTTPVVKEEVVEESKPLLFAEVMPEYPGGMDAFRKFLLKNLRQPDLDEGAKIVVRVRFVVGADGTIQNINVEQSGGELDKEVLRVVGRMPHWKPGVQNGRAVAVYFSLPVTFLGPEQ